jgi:hypothetical protein
MAVPFFDVFVANRPIYGKAISGRAFKIKVGPALHLSCPHEGLASHLVAPNPVKWLFLYIRMFGVFHKEVHGILSKGIALADHGIFFLDLLSQLPPMRKFMRKHVGGRVVLDVCHVWTSLYHQGFDTQVTEFLSCPGTTDSGADHNGLIGTLLRTA